MVSLGVTKQVQLWGLNVLWCPLCGSSSQRSAPATFTSCASIQRNSNPTQVWEAWAIWTPCFPVGRNGYCALFENTVGIISSKMIRFGVVQLEEFWTKQYQSSLMLYILKSFFSGNLTFWIWWKKQMLFTSHFTSLKKIRIMLRPSVYFRGNVMMRVKFK